MADTFHPIHDTNDRRASVAASKDRGKSTNSNREMMSRLGQFSRIQSTGGLNAHLDKTEMLPYDMRVVKYKQSGLDQKDAERAARYEWSQRNKPKETAFDVGYEKQKSAMDYAEGAVAAYTEKFGVDPTNTENGGTMIGTGAGSPVTNIGISVQSAKEAESGKPIGPSVFDNPEGKANEYGLTGRNREERIAQAEGMPRTDGKSGTYADQLLELKGLKSKMNILHNSGTGTLKKDVPKQKKGGGTATFQMPDGSIQSVRSDESVANAFKRIRSGGGETGQAAPEVKAPPKGGKSATFEKPVVSDDSAKPSAKSQLDAVEVPKSKEIPLYTGGGVAEQFTAEREAEKQAAKPKSRTEVRFDPSRVIDPIKNLFKSPQSSDNGTNNRRAQSNEARQNANERRDELKRLNEVFADAQIASGSRVRALRGDKLSEMEAIAKKYGLKLDPKKGFYR